MDAMTPRRGASDVNGSVERILTQVSLKCTTSTSWAHIRVENNPTTFEGLRFRMGKLRWSDWFNEWPICRKSKSVANVAK